MVELAAKLLVDVAKGECSMSDCGCEFEAKNKAQRKVLRILFLVNAAMFSLSLA
jgi:hypothetical protein